MPDRLTPVSFLVGPDLPGVAFLGDYHHIANAGPGLRGPTLYCAYITSGLDSATGLWTQRKCFLHKITPICVSDFNQSGAAEATDVALFYDAYSAWDGTSDLNGDGDIDLMDEALFWDTYDYMLAQP